MISNPAKGQQHTPALNHFGIIKAVSIDSCATHH